MVAVPIPRSGASTTEIRTASVPALPAPAHKANSTDWTHFLAAGAIVAGGALVAAGRRRAGVTIAAAGTALVLLEEQEIVKQWWKALPGYLSNTQEFLDRIEHYLQEATVQGQKVQSFLRK